MRCERRRWHAPGEQKVPSRPQGTRVVARCTHHSAATAAAPAPHIARVRRGLGWCVCVRVFVNRSSRRVRNARDAGWRDGSALMSRERKEMEDEQVSHHFGVERSCKNSAVAAGAEKQTFPATL